MAYINLYVSNGTKIYVKNNQVFLENKDNKADFQLEVVNCVMIENSNTFIW